MYKSQNLVERIKSAAKSKGIHVKELLSSCDLNPNTLNQISDKKGLSSFSLAKIADYLDCSVDYLLGRTENLGMTKSDLEEQTPKTKKFTQNFNGNFVFKDKVNNITGDNAVVNNEQTELPEKEKTDSSNTVSEYEGIYSKIISQLESLEATQRFEALYRIQRMLDDDYDVKKNK